MHAGTYFKVDKVAPVNEIGKLSNGKKQCSAVLGCPGMCCALFALLVDAFDCSRWLLAYYDPQKGATWTYLLALLLLHLLTFDLLDINFAAIHVCLSVCLSLAFCLSIVPIIMQVNSFYYFTLFLASFAHCMLHRKLHTWLTWVDFISDFAITTQRFARFACSRFLSALLQVCLCVCLI